MDTSTRHPPVAHEPRSLCGSVVCLGHGWLALLQVDHSAPRKARSVRIWNGRSLAGTGRARPSHCKAGRPDRLCNCSLSGNQCRTSRRHFCARSNALDLFSGHLARPCCRMPDTRDGIESVWSGSTSPLKSIRSFPWNCQLQSISLALPYPRLASDAELATALRGRVLFHCHRYMRSRCHYFLCRC